MANYLKATNYSEIADYATAFQYNLRADGDTEYDQTIHINLSELELHGDSALSSPTVTNDQLMLTTVNGNHGFNGLDTGHHGLIDGTTGQDTGSLERSTMTLTSIGWALFR